MVKLLVIHKANIDVKNQNEETPLSLAIRNDNVDIVKYLIANDQSLLKNELYFWVASFNATKSFYYLKDLGLNPNIKYKDGNTPLHVSTYGNNFELTKLLIAEGLDVNEKNKTGITPLHHAVLSNSSKLVNLLINLGANVNIENEDKITPLHLAVEKENLEIIKILLNNGADINKKTKQYLTP